MRIAVIGAGVAGLAVAHFLGERGYRDVVVLEAEYRVGGKACTVLAGGRPHDLGASAVWPAYRETLALFERYGIDTYPWPLRTSSVVRDIEGRAYLDPPVALRRAHPLRAYLRAFARIAPDLRAHSAFLTAPTPPAAPPDLCVPFAAWARARGVEPLLDFYRTLVVGAGYGPFEEVPAAHVLRYLVTLADKPRASRLLRLALTPIALPTHGFQAVVEAMAAGREVRTASQVARIDRSGPRVRLWLAGAVELPALTVDRVVVCTPPDRTLEFLDATAGERSILGAVVFTDYCATLARASGLPRKTVLTFGPDGLALTAKKMWPDCSLRVFFHYGRMAGDADLDRRLAAEIRSAGGRLEEIVARRRWRYFPRVDGAALAAGWGERLSALQGSERTFYAGSACAVETVEGTIRHARALVEEHFPALRPGAGGSAPSSNGSRVGGALTHA